MGSKQSSLSDSSTETSPDSYNAAHFSNGAATGHHNHHQQNYNNAKQLKKRKSLKKAAAAGNLQLVTTPVANQSSTPSFRDKIDHLKMGVSFDTSDSSEMPDAEELERRFLKILTSMDLPPDKAKVLRGYDDDRKWEMIRDQEKVTARQSPQSYLEKLNTYLDPKASRNSKKIRNLGGFTSTQVLRDLEISLRTNNIEWVREFLSDTNRGLDILIEYLKFRLATQKEEQLRELKEQQQQQQQQQLLLLQNNSSFHHHHNTSTGTLHGEHSSSQELNHSTHSGPTSGHSAASSSGHPTSHHSTTASSSHHLTRRPSHHLTRRPSYLFSRQHSTKVKLGQVGDDVHVCIMCLRAIMNNKFGFNLVMEHCSAINCIALSLNHKSLRTKSLVLELLAAICLVKGGHQMILAAFDHFKEELKEQRRFQTLMHYFINFETFNIDFMVACMQFINIIVHSVEDMNFRVHLQYEFTQLGLDDYLENKLSNTESEDLQVQIQAYLDNVFDVGALMEDAEQKNTTVERCQMLIQQLSHSHELEREWEAKFHELKQNYGELEEERETLLADNRVMHEELGRIRQCVNAKEEESRRRESLLESKILELEQKGAQMVTGGGPPVPAKPLVNTTSTASSPINTAAAAGSPSAASPLGGKSMANGPSLG
ncbi:PREDICTED: formin-like protein CG32138, partial [Rhagoletis zephyria]|uniref:formin-like protein CG32138 n=1 Tax=Rhagoletis zephyria TaxID=28612 RepID=UPI0008115F5A